MNLKTLTTFNTRTDAEIARGLLESNGINALVTADDKGGTDPFLTFANGVKLLVDENDIITAKTILKNTPSF
jgi:type III secretory pathway lipoprotein EscJ